MIDGIVIGSNPNNEEEEGSGISRGGAAAAAAGRSSFGITCCGFWSCKVEAMKSKHAQRAHIRTGDTVGEIQ